MPKNIDIRITFPEVFDLSNIIGSYCTVLKDDGTSFEGNFYCERH